MSFTADGTLVDLNGGGLRLETPGSVALGAAAPNGAFDLGAAEPLAHWRGVLTAQGGTATYQTADAAGCISTYDVTLSYT